MNQSFFGESENMIAAYKEAAIVFLPVPFDATSSWEKGADKAPDAIFNASAQLEYYDILTDREVFRRGMHTLPYVNTNQNTEGVISDVRAAVERVLTDKKFPVVIGGNHSVSIGAIQAVCAHYGEGLSVVQLDAHADLRQEYEGSSLNHACVMARAGECTKDIFQIGIRSMSKEEKEAIHPERVFFAHEMYDKDCWIENLTDQLAKNVYITIDLDVLDTSVMPATGTPEPGGLQYQQLIKLLAAIADKSNIVGFDVVELAPVTGLHAPDFLTAKLIYQTISLAFQKKQ
jgi:agmatinase